MLQAANPVDVSHLETPQSQETTAVPAPTLNWIVGLGAALVFGVTFLLRFQTATFVNDHFTHLSRARQIVLGEWPIRDFFDPGQFLHYYFSAAAQIVFGYNLFGEALLTIFFLSLAAALAYAVSWQLARSHAIAAWMTALAVISSPRLYNYPKVFLYVAAICLAWWYAQGPGRRRLRVLAAFTIFAFLFRYDHGAYIAVMMLVLLTVLHARRPRQWLATSAVYLALCAMLVVPFAGYVQWATGLRTYITASLVPLRLVQSRSRVPSTTTLAPDLSRSISGEIETDEATESSPVAEIFRHSDATALCYWLTASLPFVALLMVAWSRFRGSITLPEAATVTATAFFCLIAWRTILADSAEKRLADVTAPSAILGAWVMGRWLMTTAPSTLSGSAKWIRYSITAVLFLATMWSFSAQARFVESLQRYRVLAGPHAAAEEFVNTYRRLHVRPINEWAPVDDARGIRALTRYVLRCTAPADRLLVAGGFAPDVYFYAERPFAGGQVHFMPPWHTSLPEQRLTITHLEHQSIPIALIRDDQGVFDRRFSFVSSYVHSRFVEVAFDTFSDNDKPWHVLVDRHLMPVGTDPRLGLPCFRNPPNE